MELIQLPFATSKFGILAFEGYKGKNNYLTMHITTNGKVLSLRNIYVSKRWQGPQQFSCLQNNLECISTMLEPGKVKRLVLEHFMNYLKIDSNKFFFLPTYLLCMHFSFLKSSIIFFTKSNVTTSPSILAPEYCGSTSGIQMEKQSG